MTSDFLDRVKEYEGFEPHPRPCPTGYWSIGYGYNMEAHGIPPHLAKQIFDHKPITREQAADLMRWELAKSLEVALKIFGPDFGGWAAARQEAVVDLIFNMGEGSEKPRRGFRSFVNTIRCLKEGRWTEAAENLLRSKYASQVGRRAKDNARRIREGQ